MDQQATRVFRVLSLYPMRTYPLSEPVQTRKITETNPRGNQCGTRSGALPAEQLQQTFAVERFTSSRTPGCQG